MRHFFRAKGINLEIDEGHPSTGAGVSEVTTRWLAKEVERVEEPLKKLNRAGFGGLRRLAVFETDALPGTEASTAKVLYRLALLLRKLGRRHSEGTIVADRFEAVAAE